MMRLLLGAALLIGVGRTWAAYCGGAPSADAHRNVNPIITAAPVLDHSVKNGHLYIAGAGDASFSLLHVYGSAYEMGFAQGSLLPERVKNMSQSVWECE